MTFKALCCLARGPRDLNISSDRTDPGRVVIIGGGVIGLCTAFQLALLARVRNGSSAEIVVLESQETIFPSASSHNSGCLHYGYDEQNGADLRPLGKYSFDLWESLATKDDSFQRASGYRSQAFLSVVPGYGDTGELPDWVQPQVDWAVKTPEHGSRCASM